MSDLGVICERYGKFTVRSNLTSSGVISVVQNTAYFCYLGHVRGPIIINYTQMLVIVGAGPGPQTAEIGLFSSSTSPRRMGQTLIKLASSNTLSALTATGIVKNTNALNYVPTPLTYLWAGFRQGSAGVQPSLRALNDDFGQGEVLTLTGAPTFASLVTVTPNLVSVSGIVAPDLRVTSE